MMSSSYQQNQRHKLMELLDATSLSLQEIQTLNDCHIITDHDFIKNSPLKIMAILKCSHTHYQKLLISISQCMVPSSTTAMSLYTSRTSSLPTNLSPIDRILLGGLPAGTITEIAGPAGSGKTQMCFMLTVLSCLPTDCGGLNKRAIFIDTDGSFSASRLISIGRTHLQSKYTSTLCLEKSAKILASKIKVFQDFSCRRLQRRLESFLAISFKGSSDIGVLVIDSLAGVVRKEYDVRTTKGIVDRYYYLLNLSRTFKCIAEKFQIPVVLTNQITTHPRTRIVTSSLGTSWSHCINARIFIEFLTNIKRKLSVVKSPCGRPVSVIVDIGNEGIIIDHEYTAETEPISGDPSNYSLKTKTKLNIYNN